MKIQPQCAASGRLLKWRWFILAICVCAGVTWPATARAQVSPADHAKHHPGAAGMATNAPGIGAMGGMMEGMGEMMRTMHGAPTSKAVYPTLISLPDVTPEKRAEVQAQAQERIKGAVALMGEALEALSKAGASSNYAAMQDATAKLREAVAEFDSGLAAQRALAEGQAPRNVALQWFKREMNLLSPALQERGFRSWGMSPFHAAIMAALVLFAAAMIGMYFFKMRRAANLLQSLTGGAASAASVAAPTAALTQPVATTASALTSTQPKKWSGKLRVAQIFQETPTVKTFRLMNPVGGALPFTYLPGQFLTLAVLLNDKPVKRSYTIASSPTQQDFAEITVKHEEPGEVSAFLHNHVQPGDLLEFSGPSGSFIFTGRECKCILLIGGGVGITPLMSVLRYLMDRSWSGDVYFLYSIGTPAEFIFREELEYLQRRHPNLRVGVTVSRPDGTDWKGATGRITKEFIKQSVPDLASRYVHLCGPVPMMEGVKKMLTDLGIQPARIKTEAFGPVLGKPEPIPLQPAAPARTVEETAARVALPTVGFSVSEKSGPLAPDKTILDVADEVGVEIDNSCRVGTCGTCRVKLLAGQVSMGVEDGLEPGDKEKGMILACQAKSTGNVVVEA